MSQNAAKHTEPKASGFVQFLAIAAAGCVVYGIMQGVHDNYGIMMKALVGVTNVPYEDISFIIGIGALLYGFTQPVWGMLALRRSNGLVMLVGALMIAFGLIITPFCHSFAPLLLTFGIILPSGTGALGSGIILGAITPIIGEKRAAVYTGVLQASAGVGDALMSPSLQALIDWKSVYVGMGSFGALMLVTVPVIIWIGVKARKAAPPASERVSDDESLLSILRSALKNPTYLRVFLAFSTCGFNMSIIESHLFNQFVMWGIPTTESSFVMTIYGILTMLGALLTGFLSMKFKMHIVLGSVYFTRVLISVAMLLLPGSFPFAIIATAFLGLSGDSTVPPTMGLITREFGAKRIAILYGFGLAAHQIGAFLSAWFGGFCFATFGDFTWLWVANLITALFAALASWSIKDKAPAEK